METDPGLSFIHFRGVDVPPRRRWLGGSLDWRSLAGGTSRSPRGVTEPPEVRDAFITRLLEQAGLSADAYRALPLQRRIPALLRYLRVKSPGEAQALLDAKPELLPAALNGVLIGVSSFFRDPAVFDCLRRTVLPALLGTRRCVDVFSAGSSNGCELYSVAILLAEAGALGKSSLLGVDCRPHAIAQARLGNFLENELAAVESSLRERYFRPEGSVWRIDDALRGTIQWQCADLLEFLPPTCDMILFRNVAIYLEEQWAAQVWEKLCSALTPGGFLITGKAEKPPRMLPLQCVSKSVYQKKDIAA